MAKTNHARKRKAKASKAGPKKVAPLKLGNLKSELGQATVDNPFFAADHAESGTNPKAIRATLNMRESALTWYAAKKVIEPHQHAAGLRLRSLWERTGGAGAKALDYGREQVDGGQGASDGITDVKIDAANELAALQWAIGKSDYDLALTVANGTFVKDIARTDWHGRQVMKRLKETLDVIAEHWGYSQTERKAS